MIHDLLTNSFFPIIFVFIYVIFIAIVCIAIYRWASMLIKLKREQNDLLREIIHKMDEKK